MKFRLSPTVLTLLAVAAQPAAFAASSVDSLAANSPFGQAPAGTTAANANAPLEFRSVFMDRGEIFFSIYDPATRSGSWVALKDSGNPYVVRSYDAEKGSVVVEFQGRELTLALKQAKVVAMAAAPVPSANGPVVGNATGVPPAVVPGQSGDEAARLAMIAEEIRRRRSLRERANAGGTPRPVGPVPTAGGAPGAGPVPTSGSSAGPVPTPPTK